MSALAPTSREVPFEPDPVGVTENFYATNNAFCAQVFPTLDFRTLSIIRRLAIEEGRRVGMADGVEQGHRDVIWGNQQDFENGEEIGWSKERESWVSAGHGDCSISKHYVDDVTQTEDVLATSSCPSDQPPTRFVWVDEPIKSTTMDGPRDLSALSSGSRKPCGTLQCR
jgi:hypothetical protein